MENGLSIETGTGLMISLFGVTSVLKATLIGNKEIQTPAADYI